VPRSSASHPRILLGPGRHGPAGRDIVLAYMHDYTFAHPDGAARMASGTPRMFSRAAQLAPIRRAACCGSAMRTASSRTPDALVFGAACPPIGRSGCRTRDGFRPFSVRRTRCTPAPFDVDDSVARERGRARLVRMDLIVGHTAHRCRPSARRAVTDPETHNPFAQSRGVTRRRTNLLPPVARRDGRDSTDR
jgi:hypothetical protein